MSFIDIVLNKITNEVAALLIVVFILLIKKMYIVWKRHQINKIIFIKTEEMLLKEEKRKQIIVSQKTRKNNLESFRERLTEPLTYDDLHILTYMFMLDRELWNESRLLYGSLNVIKAEIKDFKLKKENLKVFSFK